MGEWRMNHGTVATLSAVLLCLMLGFTPHVAGGERGLDIYFIDVEGGAATLIVTPQGESILVDSGYPGYENRDAKRIHHVAAEVAGLEHLDHSVTTHWHLDHYGSIAALSEMMPVKHFWDRGIPDELVEDPQFPERMALYRKISGGRSRTLRPGDKLPLLASGERDVPSAELLVLVADRKVISRESSEANSACRDHQPKERDPSDNAASLGFLLSFGAFDFLCLGDLTWNVEHELVCPSNRIGEVDLYMVTHHGLNSSNNPVLVQSVRPRVAVACNGPHKGAHAEVIRTLRSVSGLEAIYQLHLNLDSSLQENTDREFIGNLEEDCEARFIKARVDAHGRGYSVSIGGAGPSRRYESR